MLKLSDIGSSLTKNQSLVLSALSLAKTPLSAYTILDNLRDAGLRAPLQVYRALEKLIELGMVHRLESLNAFIACNEKLCDRSSVIAFVICDQCQLVQEVSDNSVSFFLGQLAEQAGVKTTKSNIEVHGICNDCERT